MKELVSIPVTVCHLPLVAGLISVSPPAAAGDWHVESVVSVATGDLDGDGARDAALLVAPDPDGTDDHALIVLRGTGFDEGAMEPWLSYPNAVWGGSGMMVGNRPSVDFTASGSLLLKSGNEAIGRNRWNQTVTLAWRDNDLLVAGFTYGFHDTLDLDANGGCDINILTGNGISTDNGRDSRVSLGSQRLELSAWIAAGAPILCPDG
ncbi:MAG: hypothetical protein JJ920_17330 [Roseitalea sp.]|nr:hypothetical protein [Roseitalea sp.]MBO6723754.1 hypothetical protein [Roseitalea sp.]MBO6744678.1 hypothetical protein [Roseitalea sp.]